MKDLKTTMTGVAGGALIISKGLIAAYDSGQFTGETGWHLAAGIVFFLIGLFASDSKTATAE